jgi:uncharacterized protein (TIGR00369 family)
MTSFLKLSRLARSPSQATDGSTCLLRQRHSNQMLRPGGTISGPTLVELADFAMYVVLLSAIGPIGLVVTINLTINFLRKGHSGHDVLAAARILKLGKRLAVGEVSLLSGTSPGPIAHVTSTYSIPNTYAFFQVLLHHNCKLLFLLTLFPSCGIDVGACLI